MCDLRPAGWSVGCRMKLATEKSTEIRVLLIKSLIILCGDDGSRAAMVEEGVVEKCLSLLTDETEPVVPELQVLACRAPINQHAYRHACMSACRHVFGMSPRRVRKV